MNTYNQSLLKMAPCPFALKKARDRHRKTHTTDVVTNVGKALHVFATKYHEHCWKAGVQTDVEVVSELVNRTMVGHGLTEDDREEVMALATGFAESELVEKDKGAVDLEAEIHTPDGRFYGTPDKTVDVPGGVLIKDWKSWRRVPPLSEVQKEIQLPLYAGIILENAPDVQEFTLAITLLRHRKDITWTMTADEVRAFMAKMRRMADELDALTTFEAHGGAQCYYCEFTAECPLVAAGDIKLINTSAEKVKAAEQLAALTARVKSLTGRLKPAVEKTGPVAMKDGTVLDFHPSRTFSYDVPTVVRAFKKLGIAVEKVLDECSVSATAIKRVAKAGKLDKEQVGAVLKTGEEKVSTRFQFKRADDDDEEGGE